MAPDDHTAAADDLIHTPLTDAESLRERWVHILSPLGFSETLLWFAFVDADGTLLPALNQLPMSTTPVAGMIDVLLSRLAEVVDESPDISVAFLLSRPGRDGITEADAQWARLLVESARRHHVPLYPVHRANGTSVVTLWTPTDAAA
ncbi:hypothetical protein [Gordonia soli]|uniref:Uncharacterized protein n=1 Tax=Gordonia soli NBRC 108243 TaxID=1223545 RepID=M0QMZ7_9ACTN|nr:hypothetical protein [Gordonia soli]GAC69661.1 hypothetical protein GS4_26_01090 [Gordonia soli NBRC 108243]